MKPEEIINVVDELNGELPEEMYENGLGYYFSTNGFVDLVKFCDWVVYCSEENSEDEVEETGGLMQFILQEKNRYIDILLKVR